MVLRIIFAVSVGAVFGSICGLIFKTLNKRVKKPVPSPPNNLPPYPTNTK